ncbi:MAG: LLM class F420-dependent oxidoreductase [Chloroflexi bacterium]|nr:LLM class F420-dependent oxidoreductase [Chloroflexota bacterium]
MHVGINISISEQHGNFGALARKMEEMGFESVWLPEHPVIPVRHSSKYGGTPDGSVPVGMRSLVNPLIALSYAAAATSSIRLGTAINLVTEHHPLDLAKQISTLDMYSGGRFMFGIGTGWFREEAEALGVDFDHRGTQAREHVLAMKELWTKDEAEFHGRYVDFSAMYCYPKPTQKPHPPVLIGGSAKNVLNRVVQWGDGWIPIRVEPDEIKTARATLTRLAEEAGRDPASIDITIHSLPADRDLIRRFEEAGANRVLVRASAPDHDGSLKEIEELAAKVLG